MNRIAKTAGALALATAISTTLLLGQAKQPQVKSQKEGEAVMAIFQAQDPDARIAAVENLLTKFADTEFKPVALQVAAASAQQKNDFEKMIIYSERAIEADPKNYPSMLMIANGLAQKTRENDLDKEEKLGRSEKLAKEAIELVKVAQKPRPDIAEDQWEAAKKEYEAQGHEALGISAMVRKKWDVAVTEFKTAQSLQATPEQSIQVRLAAALNESGKPDEAIAELDKLNAVPNINPVIKQIAASERAKAMRKKGGTAAPATPAPAAAPGASTAPAPTPSQTPATPAPAPTAPKE
jgi:tetratricopeptide (TPR) repeat protein